MRFAVIVPADNFKKFGLQVERLLPAIKPKVIAPPEPVLVIAGLVSIEPRRDWHQVRLPVQVLQV